MLYTCSDTGENYTMDFTFEDRLSDSPLVDTIWRTYSSQAGVFQSQAVSHWEMVVWHYEGETRITVRGPETKVTQADSPPDTEFFGIRFKVGSYMPYLPMKKLVDNDLTFPEATGKAFWLGSEVWEIPTFDSADVFDARMKRKGLLANDSVISAVLSDQPTELSVRALQYRFKNVTGLTQNAIRQIERSRQATTLLQQGQSILDVTHEMGYFDQAHLTRSLKRFMGQTPSELMNS